ncbi:hypothetical protein J19TS2_43440 [Cohnella xylanilytica]|nr:hypothetical protein J19TS2_43440 [Cohnella xylanilytica]
MDKLITPQFVEGAVPQVGEADTAKKLITTIDECWNKFVSTGMYFDWKRGKISIYIS